MEIPAVSVVMPVYNGSEFLKEAIQSILNQSFRNFEFLIINDGSIDSSDAIIESFAKSDSRINYINRKSNKGIVFTLNEGLSLCRGKYIARMDADDISDPKRLEKQLTFFYNNEDIYALGTAYTVFNEEGIKKTVKRNYPPIYMGFKFISDTYLCHPSVMFEKEVIGRVGNYLQTEAEDFNFFSRLSQSYKCANMEESYLLYREHQSNRSFEFNSKIKDSVYETYLKNYSFYIDDKHFLNIFYDFHKRLKGKIVYVPKYILYSMRILNKIRKNYGVKFLSKEFMQSVILFYTEIIQQLSIKLRTKFLK